MTKSKAKPVKITEYVGATKKVISVSDPDTKPAKTEKKK